MASAWQAHEQARCVAASRHLRTLSQLLDRPRIGSEAYECMVQLTPLLLATPTRYTFSSLELQPACRCAIIEAGQGRYWLGFTSVYVETHPQRCVSLAACAGPPC